MSITDYSEDYAEDYMHSLHSSHREHSYYIVNASREDNRYFDGIDRLLRNEEVYYIASYHQAHKMSYLPEAIGLCNYLNKKFDGNFFVEQRIVKTVVNTWKLAQPVDKVPSIPTSQDNLNTPTLKEMNDLDKDKLKTFAREIGESLEYFQNKEWYSNTPEAGKKITLTNDDVASYRVVK